MSVPVEPVAVIGMACRFPGGPDIDAYWKLLLSGGTAIIEVPPTRWNLDALRQFNDGQPLPYNATHGGWLPRVRDFDNVFFRMSPREARTLDPKQRLSLEVTYEAFEDANLSPGQLRGRSDVGIWLGTAQSEYLMRFYNRMEVSGKKADRYSGPGNDVSFSSGRISAMFGLEGPSINVNTACSTSLVAVHQAVRAIQDGECDIAAAGGVSIIQSPEHSLVMSKFNVLSPDSKCKAFDANADGYVRAEGCGMIVLRRLSDALAAGDRIYAVISGSAVNHNGLSDNLMAPDTDAQIRLLNRALAVGGTDPGTVDVVEAHGTGTAVGDPIEIHALEAVFAAGHDDKHPLYVASVKTNIGHLEVGAGIAGLVKAVLEVHHGQIPAHLNLETLNPAISPDLPFVYPKRLAAWPKTPHPRRAVVNSFGISGINAAVVLEQAPEAQDTLAEGSPRPVQLLPISAYGDVPLRSLAGAYADLLASGVPLPDVACTAAIGRDHHPSRLVVTAADAATATAALRAFAGGAEHAAIRTGDARAASPRTAFLFTGQGAQHVGMGKALYATEPVFREALDAADAAFAPHLGRSIRQVMFGDDTEVDLDDTGWTQPALFAIEWALAALWRAWGVQPDVMVGHSIGELTAAAVAGVFTLDDAARLVAARGRLMSALPHDGAMAAIFAPADEVREALRDVDGVDIAADNGPKATVVSGRTEGVDAVCALFDKRDVGTRRLTVSHAFHSVLMDPMLEPFREVAASIPMRTPQIPILSNLTGAMASDDMTTAEYWVQHVRRAVRFREGVEGLVAQGVTAMIEIGPQGTLLGMARRCVRSFKGSWLPSLQPEQPYETLLDSVATLYLDGALPGWLDFWAHHQAPRVALPRYPFQRKPHWVDDPGPPQGQVAATAAPTPAPSGAPSPSAFDRSAAYRMSWVPCAPPTTEPVQRGTYLVGLDASGVGAELARTLTAQGFKVIKVSPAHLAEPRARDTQVIDVTRPEGFQALVDQHKADLRGWVHTWCLDIPEDDTAPAEWWTANQDPGSLASLFIAQALLGARVPGAALWTITRGADAVHPGESPRLGQAGAWGVARVIALEHRGFANIRVDLDPAGGGEDRLAALLTQRPTNEDQLAFRKQGTYALRLTPHRSTGASIRPVPGTAWVITGGLGALGLAVAEELVAHGATHLVLCGRSAPKPDAQAAIDRMKAAGAEVLVESLDIANPTHVTNLFKYLDHKLPVRGVVHCAGVLADGPVLQQDRERFYKVFPAKVEGAWNLHLATRDRDLDAFVLFSSVTSSLGAPGQVNYAAANAFMDALAWHRHARGLPATSINWGPWGEVGMAARLSELMASRGMGGIKTAEGVRAMIDLGADLLPQVSFMDMRVHTLMQRDPAFQHAPLVRELVALARGEDARTPARAPASAQPPAAAAPPAAATQEVTFLDQLRATPQAGRRALVASRLAELSEDLLGIDRGSLGHGRPLAWQGFDSVMAIDLNEAIGRTFGRSLPQQAVTVGPSIDDLADQLLEALALPASVTPLPTPPPAQARAIATAPARQAAAVPPTAAAPAPAGLVATLAGAPGPQREGVLLAALSRWGEELLGFEAGELDPGRPLAWQGFDSVMAVDLHGRIQAELGVDLPLDQVLHGPRLSEVAAALLPRLDLSALPAGPAAPAPVVQPPSPAPGPAAGSSREALERMLVSWAEELLGFEPGELDTSRPLAWQGFDSVMAVDLHGRILAETGVDLPLDRVLHGPRLGEVIDELAPRVAPGRLAVAPAVAPAQATPAAKGPATQPAPAPSVAPPRTPPTDTVPSWTPPESVPATLPDPSPAPTASSSVAWAVIAAMLTAMALGWWAFSDDVETAEVEQSQGVKKKGKGR